MADPEDNSGFAAQMAQQQLQQLQQQQLQKQLLAQQLLMSGAGAVPAAAPGAAAAPGEATRKQREIYVGNLAIGVLTPDLLKEFFNQVFAAAVPDPVVMPPVANVNMDPTGRFAFVEFRTEELCTKALEMDKIELMGRSMNIGRPKGYIPPMEGAPPPISATLQAAAAAAAAVSVAPSTALLLVNALPAGALRNEEDRSVLGAEVREEAAEHGHEVSGVAVPPPPATLQDRQPGRVYIKYATPEGARKGKEVFDGRTLDGNKIRACYVVEAEWTMALQGQWLSKQHNIAGLPLPGLYSITPLPTGITGLAALNPALCAMVQTNPGITAMITAGISEDEVPFEEGWVKLRGIPGSTTKAEISEFFKAAAPGLGESDIKLVVSADGTPLGEAFVQLRGQDAKLRLALAKDGSAMPFSHTTVEVMTSLEEDMRRRGLSGCMLI